MNFITALLLYTYSKEGGEEGGEGSMKCVYSQLCVLTGWHGVAHFSDCAATCAPHMWRHLVTHIPGGNPVKFTTHNFQPLGGKTISRWLTWHVWNFIPQLFGPDVCFINDFLFSVVDRLYLLQSQVYSKEGR